MELSFSSVRTVNVEAREALSEPSFLIDGESLDKKSMCGSELS